MKSNKLQQNPAGGIDLLTERDAGNPVLILTGKPENSLKFWRSLSRLSKQAIGILKGKEVKESVLVDIVNVIEIKKGILNTIQSFPIFSDDDKQEIVDKAEALFLKLASENGSDESDYFKEDLLDMGNWDNENGYEVLIVWSHNIHK